MKAIKYISLALVLLFISCDPDDDRLYSNENGRFVRFFLQLNNNGEPLTAPTVSLSSTAVSNYTKSSVTPLKIPVTLTSEPLSEPVTVTYSAEINGLNNVRLEPANQLSFSGSQLVDTLTVIPTELWDPNQNPFIDLRLTGTSDPSIAIGIPNDSLSNNRLRIDFGPVELKYNISSPSRVDLSGTQGEMVEITIDFPNGYLPASIENVDFFTVTQSNFGFTLERQTLTAPDQVTFLFTVNENFTDDDLLYKTSLALNPIEGYEQTGAPTIILRRDPLTPRDKTVNTAAQFYDTNDPFYRTFGLHWFDFNADGICSWQDFNAFTNPVVVSADDPNAVLADDRGTADPSDDIYYHAFRISFNANNAGFTTNPFDLKRWFTNEASSSSTSPGFNMIPALEFFPENGNSSTQGVVQVIDQTLQIGTTESNGSITEFLEISGAGTYREIAPGLIEINIDVSVTNNRLFGGTRTDSYRIYNSSNFTDPPDLTIDCKIPIAL